MTGKPARKVTWRTFLTATMGLVALTFLLYNQVADWWNDRLHAEALDRVNEAVVIGPDAKLEAIRVEAQAYNQQLLASGKTEGYMEQIDPAGGGVMGRIKIPNIGVDIPIFHTSNDDVLRRGAGHMAETTLPVGGENTHAAITAHRGLAQSRLFTDLDKVEEGHKFTLEVLGEALVYEVFETRIVDPHETDGRVVQPGRDLVTLITCDPLGINTERMLVTGERVIPTPVEDIEGAMQRSDQPRFPWWLVAAVAGVLVLGGLARWARKPTVVAAAGKDDDEDEESEESPSSQSQMLAGDLG